jgi:hypothetical protein
VSDHFEFTSEFVGETFEEAVDVAASNAPVDPVNPGFASLVTALERHRIGEVDKSVLWEYAVKLGLHVADCREKLGKMEAPEPIRAHFEVAMGAMMTAMEEFQAVIDNLSTYLETDSPEELDLTQRRLEWICYELPGFISQMKQYSELQPLTAE